MFRSGGKNIVVYLDDVVLYGKTVEEVWASTRKVLRELCKAGFMINVNKCNFLSTSVDAVGF